MTPQEDGRGSEKYSHKPGMSCVGADVKIDEQKAKITSLEAKLRIAVEALELQQEWLSEGINEEGIEHILSKGKKALAQIAEEKKS